MSFRFNGTEGIVDCGSASDTDDIWIGGATVMGWIYLDGYGGGGFGRLIGKEGNDGLGGWSVFVDLASSGRFQFLRDTNASQGQWASPTASVSTGQWYHICVRWTQVALATTPPTLTVDGANVAATVISSPSGTFAGDSSHSLRVGNRGNEDRTFDGRIEDIKIYGRELSDSEVFEIYAAQGKDFNVDDLIRRFPLGPNPKGQAPNTPFIASTTVADDDPLGSVDSSVPDHMDGDLLVLIGFAGGDGSDAPTFGAITGWTSRQYLAFPSTASTPAINIWTRIASSEPATYAVTSIDDGAMVVHMASYRGPSDSVDAVGTATGTSAAPSSPTITTSVNSLILRVMGVDSANKEIDPRIDMFPADLRGRFWAEANGLIGNGGALLWGDESWDDSATGARVWAISASDQWGCISIAFPWGGGIGGLPCKDLSDAQVHGESVGGVLSDEGQLTLSG